jgi:hypothetical protein
LGAAPGAVFSDALSGGHGFFCGGRSTAFSFGWCNEIAGRNEIGCYRYRVFRYRVYDAFRDERSAAGLGRRSRWFGFDARRAVRWIEVGAAGGRVLVGTTVSAEGFHGEGCIS